MLTWRDIRRADLAEALSIQPASIGDALVGQSAALRAWDTLPDHLAFRGIVVEADPPIAGHRIVACGAGVFVQAEFADRELAYPRVDLNSRVLSTAASGAPLLVDRTQIGRANAGDGLDVVNLLGSWRSDGLSATDVAQIGGLLAESFRDAHRGFRLRRLLREAIGLTEIALMRSNPAFHIVQEFPEHRRALTLVTAGHADAAPLAITSLMFAYRPPKLRLRETDQELLTAVLRGRTDDELVGELHISVGALKKRWLALFDRVARVEPSILGPAEIRDGEGRGAQKRHHVLSYVREHPEELRPFDWGYRRPT
jgi:hypothetical protein